MRSLDKPRADVCVRRARPSDCAAAGLVFSSAPGEYTRLAGSPQRARASLRQLWARGGHSASYEFAWIAEVDDHLAGVGIGFPARSRYRLHVVLLRKAVRDMSVRRLLLLPPALAWLVVAASHPPRGSFYVSTVAVNPAFLRCGVASSLLDRMRERACEIGSSQLAAHTGARHRPMRSVFEHYGFRLGRERRGGYVLYLMDLVG